MDEEALLKQFAAQFAHGPDDADDTDAAAAAQGADSTANQVADDADQSPATFDTPTIPERTGRDFRSPHGRHRSRPVLGTGDGGRGKTPATRPDCSPCSTKRWASIARKVGTRRISGLCSERWNWPLVWA